VNEEEVLNELRAAIDKALSGAQQTDKEAHHG
jgi:hypothetical protein